MEPLVASMQRQHAALMRAADVAGELIARANVLTDERRPREASELLAFAKKLATALELR